MSSERKRPKAARRVPKASEVEKAASASWAASDDRGEDTRRGVDRSAIDLDDYDFALRSEQIAQEPPAERDGARLLRLSRGGGARSHHAILDLPALLAPGDLLVVNTTRVLSARLRGQRTTGGAADALVLGPGSAPNRFRALVRTRGRQRAGMKFRFAGNGAALDAELVSLAENGEVELAFAEGASPYAIGEMPLPPYIRRSEPRALDALRYQTVFAREPGSVAAPTAGLHLSETLLAALAARGIERAEVVLHVGRGTFAPLSDSALRARRLHAERFALPDATARAIRAARERGSRVVAVGTTTARVLESCVEERGEVVARAGTTELFLAPGDRFRAVDALLTNFHLPRSSLLLLVAAFAGRKAVLAAYAEAIQRGYRFYSYGDAMLIL
jgi:S-adenosylmethionine:tRNA ribosyltransferase-isomerase